MTTNPTQAQKYFWLGLSRNLQSVSEDDVPQDAVTIDSYSITSPGPNYPITIDITLTNTLSQQITMTLTYIHNEVKVKTETITFASDESKSLTHTIPSVEGPNTVKADIGSNSASQTIIIY